jgi:hypothetical protein
MDAAGSYHRDMKPAAIGVLLCAVLALFAGVRGQQLRQAWQDHRDLRARTAAARKARWTFLPPAAWWWAGLLFVAWVIGTGGGAE